MENMFGLKCKAAIVAGGNVGIGNGLSSKAYDFVITKDSKGVKYRPRKRSAK